MKNISRISKYLVLTVVTLAIAASASAQQMIQAQAKVVRIKGDARYATANNVWQPLKVGDVLNSGAIIQTAKNSRVDLVLGEKNALAPEPAKWGDVVSYSPEVEQDFVRVWENSVMAIDKLLVADTGADKIKETQLDLRAGRIFGTVKKLSAASKYEVKIPNGVAGIRGTIYDISAEGLLCVMKGSVVIAYQDGGGAVVTQIVVGGQAYDIRTGQFTPIPENIRRDGRDGEHDSHSGHHEPPHHFPPPPHVHVSPTEGHHGHHGNNGGGNNNNNNNE